VLRELLDYIRERQLMRAGDRVGIAVSGGADSVALLRAMLELRDELGVVLSVAHFHHGIRADADSDQQFVNALADRFDLDFHVASADVPAHAAAKHMTLEAAGRELRYRWMRGLIAEGKLDKIATAHTLDDQAETVLMRVIRGSGTRGLAGIYPSIIEDGKAIIIRPFLQTARSNIVQYLRAVGQEWREDSTNLDLAHSRNRVRHDLIPVLETKFNPSLRRTLSDNAEVARAEEQFWEARVASRLPAIFHADDRSLRLRGLEHEPLAMQRRLIRAAADALGITLEFQHVEELLRFAFGEFTTEAGYRSLVQARGRRLALPENWFAASDRGVLHFAQRDTEVPQATFSALLAVPGQVRVPELGSTFRASIVSVNPEAASYNPATALDARKLASELVVRNWQAGDRFWPLHTSRAEKLKRLLQDKKVPAVQRASWPVVLCGETIVWVRGFPIASEFAAHEGGPAIEIDELRD
jgi:tRNA(Ile)-lysidine synthase